MTRDAILLALLCFLTAALGSCSPKPEHTPWPTSAAQQPGATRPPSMHELAPEKPSGMPASSAETPSPPAPPSRQPPTAAGRQAALVLCQGAQPTFVTDLEVHQTPNIAEPAPRTPFRDPVFGSCIVRVTDRESDLVPGDPARGLKNEYSRVQSFNADGTRMVVRTIEADWYLYDARSLQPLGRMEFSGAEPRWDASNPDNLLFSDETRLMSYNVQTRERSLVHDFAADFPGQRLTAVWTRHEGSPSLDGRYWGLVAQDEDSRPVSLLVYDRQTDGITARRDLRGLTGPRGEPLEPDNVTISPLGNYFLADFSDNYCEQGTLGNDGHPCGLMVYDRNLRNGRGVLRVTGHADLALDARGREVWVFQDPSSDNISMVDLATGDVTELWPVDFSHTAQGMHISGRALRRPGWAVVSTYNGGHPTDFTWMDDQVLLIELKKDGRVVRLAHNHTLYDENVEQDYWAEPHASPNQDLTRILFTSNWGRTGTDEVDMYMIQLPADWPARLP